jgi:hypothetical protein
MFKIDDLPHRYVLTASGLGHPDWGLVFDRVGLLLSLAALMAWLAARAYRTYQRSL